jgi:radical SAM protein with 4Fe4S-binding SPASM domain
VNRVRFEPWGAWVRLGDDAPREPIDLRGALVALDRDEARLRGLDGGDRWRDGTDRESAPLEVHVAVTSRCAAGCTGCYQNATVHGEHVERAALRDTLDALARDEVFTVAFGGGEPILRDDLAELADLARARGLLPVVTTSGLGLTKARARELRAFAQVNVSYDGAGDAYAKVRGFEGATHAERAIVLLRDAGVRVGVNVVLTRETFPALEPTLLRARELGAVEAQLLRYKPAGRAASLDYLARRLDPAQIAAFPGLLRALHDRVAPMSLRIDCALVCFLSGDAEIANHPERLVASGILGCEAGAALGAIRADQTHAPCSFSPSDTDAARLRAFVAAPPEPCASCSIQSVCRGGCRVVAGFDAGDRAPHPFALAPDPECPRVRALQAS